MKPVEQRHGRAGRQVDADAPGQPGTGAFADQPADVIAGMIRPGGEPGEGVPGPAVEEGTDRIFHRKALRQRLDQVEGTVAMLLEAALHRDLAERGIDEMPEIAVGQGGIERFGQRPLDDLRRLGEVFGQGRDEAVGDPVDPLLQLQFGEAREDARLEAGIEAGVLRPEPGGEAADRLRVEQVVLKRESPGHRRLRSWS